MATVTRKAPQEARVYVALLVQPGRPTELLEVSKSRIDLETMSGTFDRIVRAREQARIVVRHTNVNLNPARSRRAVAK
jgi:hypothetical protein